MLLYNVSAKQLHDDCFWVTNTCVLYKLFAVSIVQSGKCLPCLSHVHPYYNPIWAPFVGGNSQSWNVGQIWVALLSLKMVRSVLCPNRASGCAESRVEPNTCLCLICWHLLTSVDIPPMQQRGFFVKMFSLFTLPDLRWFGERNPTGETQHQGVQCLCSCSTVVWI